jgi:hypothetical protein
VWALGALHSHSHYWLCYLGNTRVTATQFWCRSVISSVIRASFSNHLFFIHISHSFCPLSFISRSKSSLWTPNYQLIKTFSILMVEETGVPGGNHRYVTRAVYYVYFVGFLISSNCKHLDHCPIPMSGPAITAHGSLDLKQEIQIQIHPNSDSWVTTQLCFNKFPLWRKFLLYFFSYPNFVTSRSLRHELK